MSGRVTFDEHGIPWGVTERADALSFLSIGGSRRLLRPIPAEWSAASDAQLRRWLARAEPMPEGDEPMGGSPDHSPG